MRLHAFAPGQRFQTRRAPVDPAEVAAFAAAYDPQPLHLDPEAAARGAFGRVVASGYHTLALSWRLWVDVGAFGEDVLAGLGLDEVRWHHPVYPGDTLAAEVEVLEARPSRRHPDRGVVRLGVTVRNQAGTVVLTYRTAALVRA
jgi:acyl dehydratase